MQGACGNSEGSARVRGTCEWCDGRSGEAAGKHPAHVVVEHVLVYMPNTCTPIRTEYAGISRKTEFRSIDVNVGRLLENYENKC